MNYTDKIDLKKTYYYNNRPVTLLQKTSERMYLVCANTSGITTELEASNFCSACNVGDSDNKLSHTCEEAEVMLEDFLDEVSQENEVFWVDKRLLKEQYFEHKANDALLKNIDKMKEEKEKLLLSIDLKLKDKFSINKEIEDKSKLLNKYKIETASKLEDLEKLTAEVSEIETNLKDVKIVSDMGISIEITPKKYEELLISSNRLNSLENGGVDNWDWYGESLGDIDYNEEAKMIIAEAFKQKLLT